jgi:hypothetical protein
MATRLQPDVGEFVLARGYPARVFGCEECVDGWKSGDGLHEHQVGGEFANLPANMSVRVIDISSAGVLLQSARMLSPGARGSLRFTLAGAPFAADIQVQRVVRGV